MKLFRRYAPPEKDEIYVTVAPTQLTINMKNYGEKYKDYDWESWAIELCDTQESTKDWQPDKTITLRKTVRSHVFSKLVEGRDYRIRVALRGAQSQEQVVEFTRTTASVFTPTKDIEITSTSVSIIANLEAYKKKYPNISSDDYSFLLEVRQGDVVLSAESSRNICEVSGCIPDTAYDVTVYVQGPLASKGRHEIFNKNPVKTLEMLFPKKEFRMNVTPSNVEIFFDDYHPMEDVKFNWLARITTSGAKPQDHYVQQRAASMVVKLNKRSSNHLQLYCISKSTWYLVFETDLMVCEAGFEPLFQEKPQDRESARQLAIEKVREIKALLKALTSDRVILLVGECGAGKSSLIRTFMIAFGNSPNEFPVVGPMESVSKEISVYRLKDTNIYLVDLPGLERNATWRSDFWIELLNGTVGSLKQKQEKNGRQQEGELIEDRPGEQDEREVPVSQEEPDGRRFVYTPNRDRPKPFTKVIFVHHYAATNRDIYKECKFALDRGCGRTITQRVAVTNLDQFKVDAAEYEGSFEIHKAVVDAATILGSVSTKEFYPIENCVGNAMLSPFQELRALKLLHSTCECEER